MRSAGGKGSEGNRRESFSIAGHSRPRAPAAEGEHVMKRNSSKVVLHRETLHQLDKADLAGAAGAIPTSLTTACCTHVFTICVSCNRTCTC